MLAEQPNPYLSPEHKFIRVLYTARKFLRYYCNNICGLESCNSLRCHNTILSYAISKVTTSISLIDVALQVLTRVLIGRGL